MLVAAGAGAGAGMVLTHSVAWFFGFLVAGGPSGSGPALPLPLLPPAAAAPPPLAAHLRVQRDQLP